MNLSSALSSPHRIHRRRGESSFGSCLLMIVIALGGAMFMWGKFGKNRCLIRAGQQCVIAKEFSQDADQEYKRHYRDRHRANTEQSRTLVNKLYTDTIKGKYKDKNSDFDQAYNEADQKLIDSITELDQNTVPPYLGANHKRLSASYRPLYESAEATKAAFYAEGDEKKKSFELAKQKLDLGWKESQIAMDAIWNQITR